jgi:serine protease inhibitor
MIQPGTSTWKASTMALALALAATPLPDGTPDGPAAMAGDDKLHPADVPDLDHLGLGIYAQLNRRADENLLLSPVSTATALAMVLSGARGENARHLADRLHLPADPGQRDRVFSGLLESMATREDHCTVTLAVANGLWYQQGLDVRNEYRRTIQSLYRGWTGPVEFRLDPEGSRSAINAWVDRETRHKIPDLLTPGTVSPETRLILANALYFCASWGERFPPSETRTAPFRSASGAAVDVPMMHRSGLYRYTVTRGAEILELPYEGGRFAFVILLPKQPGGLPRLEQAVIAEGLGPWLSKLPEKREFIDVFVPRFELDLRVRLDEALQSFGLGKLFDGEVDLSGIAPQAPPVSGMLAQVRLRVDERGSEGAAAAATGVERSVPPTVRADHPFLFLVRDRQTRVTLFLGRLTDPRGASVTGNGDR